MPVCISVAANINILLFRHCRWRTHSDRVILLQLLLIGRCPSSFKNILRRPENPGKRRQVTERGVSLKSVTYSGERLRQPAKRNAGPRNLVGRVAEAASTWPISNQVDVGEMALTSLFSGGIGFSKWKYINRVRAVRFSGTPHPGARRRASCLERHLLAFDGKTSFHIVYLSLLSSRRSSIAVIREMRPITKYRPSDSLQRIPFFMVRRKSPVELLVHRRKDFAREIF